MSNTGILTLVALTMLGAFLMQMPIAVWADRQPGVHHPLLGAATWAAFSIMTRLSTAIWMLIVARAGAGIGRAVVDPTHASLLSDWFPVDRRPAVFSFHRAANVPGPVPRSAAGRWDLPDRLAGAVPGLRRADGDPGVPGDPDEGADPWRPGAPGVGRLRREVVETEEPIPSFAESWRLLWKIEVLRRIWYAVPFLAVSLIGFVSLASLLYSDVYRLDELQRGTWLRWSSRSSCSVWPSVPVSAPGCSSRARR